jgi:hypothetical protein
VAVGVQNRKTYPAWLDGEDHARMIKKKDAEKSNKKEANDTR